MMPTRQLHALAATARLANIPSVVGNVWLGIALGAMVAGKLSQGHALVIAALLGVSGVCLYLAGNFLNDWADRQWDAAHRPERALPQGVIAPGFYRTVARVCGALGLLVAAMIHLRCGLVALLLVLCIVIYTRFHKCAAWSVIPLGLCRALLPVLGFTGVAALNAVPVAGRENQPAWLLAALAACACGLLLHIAGLSLSARRESLGPSPSDRTMAFGRILFPAAALAMFVASSQCLALPLLPCLLGLLPYGLWITLCLTTFRQPLPVQVANLLAGIPLVDWIVLLPLALTQGATREWTALTSVSLLLPPLACLLGKLLQRLAPAT